jgi:lipopolysaccharide transport system ATP-binding protein
VKSRLEAIVEFSELGDFMDRPIQIYSTGMFLRLAFSLFACLEPDVYIIDEGG